MTSAVTDAAPTVRGTEIERTRERSVMVITISLETDLLRWGTKAISVEISYWVLLFFDISRPGAIKGASSRFGYPPQIPARHRPIGLPAPAALGDLRRAGYVRSGAERDSEALAQPVVLGRQDVRATEPEDQQHLRRPAADPPHLDQSLDDLVVGHRRQLGERRQLAVDDPLGQISHGQRFGARQSGGPQLFVRGAEYAL